MTASNTKSAASKNSVSQETEDRGDAPANDIALVQGIEYASGTADSQICRGCEIEPHWSAFDCGLCLQWVNLEGDVVGKCDQQLIELTNQNGGFARGER